MILDIINFIIDGYPKERCYESYSYHLTEEGTYSETKAYCQSIGGNLIHKNIGLDDSSIPLMLEFVFSFYLFISSLLEQNTFKAYQKYNHKCFSIIILSCYIFLNQKPLNVINFLKCDILKY